MNHLCNNSVYTAIKTFGRVVTARTAGGQTSTAIRHWRTLRVRLCESQSGDKKKCDLEYSHCR